MLGRNEAIEKMNLWGGDGRPFLFILDFEGNRNYLYLTEEIPGHIKFELSAKQQLNSIKYNDFTFNIDPVSFSTYETAFNKVIAELNYGNSYLINLTFPTHLITDLSLATIYERSRARYKLLVDDKFVVFSPETFIRIDKQKIHSYPMKGTIDAGLPNAEKLILESPKEKAEHATIVDLIRNDLNRIADNVRVKRFRYIDKLDTFKGSILQVSSEIIGDLRPDYKAKLGTIIFSLLPAGSISGAPKNKTVQIIKEAEQVDREFFTGVFGVFDGTNMDSAVMIRFIEKKGDQLIFKSGGGITAQSEVNSEYNEMIQKVYVPFV